ncbi:peptide deformylase [Clostridium sp. DSM 8431]|uniref:peptide deformylase n=1 Tax=Clostridium sp. DSM 8431 TaxID=1761781 RepID=UPI0008E5F92A|nr:peptide deformylase [Clostridium sp. DSM 8431]SFU90870.1 peptide deformylase [Clostridium sp. DSM 8431]
MIKPIMKDVIFLGQKSEEATIKDKGVVIDLMDTLRANLDGCVGMAANMIGVKKRIIVICAGEMIVPMINPVITKKEEPYEAEESCLSLAGVRKTKRYNKINVEYLDKDFNKRQGTFSGFTAQIIQHEVDHCNGIII